ncbi:MAG: hypothetical protein L7G90_01870 [Candidatus Nanopusillus sp.]|nr:hypothetical protein [Candidatus Nanopusillus sp.]MCG2868850.1 hypothetical protein [Candidatus Nanopusillus sp.]
MAKSDPYYYSHNVLVSSEQNQGEVEIGASFSGIIYNNGNATVDVYIYKESQLGDSIIPGQVLRFQVQPFQFLRIRNVWIAKIKFIFNENNNSNNTSTIQIAGVLSPIYHADGYIDLEGVYVNAQIINFPQNAVPVDVINDSSNPVPVSVTNTPTVNANVTNSSSNPVYTNVVNTVNTNVTNTPNVVVSNSTSNPVPIQIQPNASLLGYIVNGSVSANSNFFSSNLSISQASKIKIIIMANSSGVLSLSISYGGTTVTANVNGGSSLSANAWYEFEIDLPGGSSINFQYSTSATITIFVIATPLG